MNEKFRDENRKRSVRLSTWDYSWNAAYLITICTKSREHFFGEIINTEMILSGVGELALSFGKKFQNISPSYI